MTQQHTPPEPAGTTSATTSEPPGAPDANDPPRLVSHSHDPVSAEFLALAKLHYLQVADGVRLRTAYWKGHSEPARATVMVLTGYSEFIEKYFETARDLTNLGFAVLCFDWRGQGLSTRAQTGRRGWVPNYEIMLDDVRELAAYCESLNAPRPLVALGHSMGGNVCLRLLQTDTPVFTAAALTAPMLGLKGMPTWLLRSITQTGARVGMDEQYAPGAKDNDPYGPHIPLCADTSRIDIWRDYLRTEPMLITHGVTWRWASEAARSMQLVNQPENIARIKTPVLIANAMQDSLVDPVPTQKFAAACEAVQSLELATSEHEVLQEIDSIRNEFFRAFDEFMSAAIETSAAERSEPSQAPAADRASNNG